MITFDEPTPAGDGAWRFTWTSDQVEPTYRVYLDGTLVSTQTEAFYDLRVEGEAAPVLEVLDEADDVPSPAHPPYLVLGWIDDADAAEYRVEKYNGATWDIVKTYENDGTLPYWTHTTGILDDETTHQFRVIPVDAAGNDGSGKAFTALMVRHPSPPDVSMTYDSGTATVTIAAA